MRRSPCPLPILALTCALALAAPQPGAAQFSFTDRTSLLSNTGFGVARCSSGVSIGVVDMDGDGRDDIVRLHDNHLLAIETQAAPGAAFGHRFLGDAGIDPWALCVADVDRDGSNDLVLAPFGGGIRLYSSDPGAPGGYAVSLLPRSDIDCQGTIFADLNRDGQIDLFSCHDTADNVKWENYGGGELVTNPALIETDLGADSGGNYAAIWSDIDKDGQPELYLSKCSQGETNPSSPTRINRLFKSTPAGFIDVAPAAGLASGAQSWSTDFADIDNDGDLDCFILNHPEPGTPQPSRLMENTGGSFRDITNASGLGASLAGIYGIQVAFRDFDNDGFVDLLVSSSDLAGAAPTYRLYHNGGDRTFARQAGAFVAGGTTGGAGSALGFIQSFAIGDLDHDGFLDVYTGRASAFDDPSNLPDLLFMNDGNANHFLAVQLTGTVSNRNAIGARVEIYGPWGVQTREVRAGEGYGIMNSLTAHFGLGAADRIDRVLVTWPSGFTTEVTDVAADQFLALTEVVDPGAFSPPSLTSPTSATTLAGAGFTYRIHADQNPQSFAIADAPAGMSVTPTGTVRWTPQAAGTFTFGVTAANVAGSDTQTVSVEVLPNLLPAAIEAEGFLVNTGSDHPWGRQTAVTHDGADAAQAGVIADGGASFMEVAVAGPGQATFWWRVSSEQDFDFLELELDDALVDSLSGNSGWRQKTLSVPAGEHTIRWSYTKDGSVSEGQDTGWVDQLSYLSPDSDRDGLADAWEVANFGNLAQTGGGDFDGDGQDNASEEASGTDPKDPASALRVTSIETVDAQRLRLTWEAVAGITYAVQASGDLANWSDVATGIAGSGTGPAAATVFTSTPTAATLVGAGAPAYALVPADDALGTLWRGGDEAGFAGAGGLAAWTAGSSGVGYDADNADFYGPYIGLDVQAEMFNTNSSVYVRIPFGLADPASIVSLTLQMRYDDGFVAFLNGTRVADANAPASLTPTAAATTNATDANAVVFQPFDLTAAIGDLIAGDNVLAIHGLNRTPQSSDLLLQPELTAEQVATAGTARAYWRVIVQP